jgi:hypothetical protein
MMMSALYNMFYWIFIMLTHWNNSPWVDMLLHCDKLFWFRTNRSYTCGNIDCISSVRVSRLVLSAVDQEFEPGLDQTKDYEIDICCISAKHTALRSMNKDWLVRNQNNLSQWSNMSTHGLLFQWMQSILPHV